MARYGKKASRSAESSMRRRKKGTLKVGVAPQELVAVTLIGPLGLTRNRGTKL